MISVTNVSVHFGERALLDNVNFVVGERDRVGLVGRNGAGKSTIMKIIAGQVVPNGGGQIVRPNNTTLGFLHQDMTIPKGKTVMNEALTAFEEIKILEKRIAELQHELETREDYESDAYMDLITELTDTSERFEIFGGATSQAEAERVLKGLGFKTTDMNRLTDEFSGGWQMRIELAKMLLQRPTYLLLDEPTNHLDIESILWLEKFLEDYPGAVIVISHDKQFLDNVTKRTVEIVLGKLHEYKASYSKYVELRADRRALQQNAFENQQRVIADKERTIARFMAKANKTKMAQSMQKQLEKMDRVEIDEEDIKAMNIRFAPSPRSGQVVTQAAKLSKSYGLINVLEEIDFKMDRGDRVAFVGQNGQGKSTLAKILVGMESLTGGECVLGHNVQIGYYAQNQAEALYSDLTVLQTAEQGCPADMRSKIRGILGAFMFTGDDSDKKVVVLSGGERARLALACLMLKPFNLLLLDEPTNHLDMISKEVMKEALMQYDGSLIVVSHDREFLDGLTTRTIEFRDRKLYEHLGDVNYFLAKRGEDNMREVEMRTKTASTPNGNKPARVEDEQTRKKLERAVQQMERRIEELEEKIGRYERTMGEDNFYNRPEAQKITDEYNALKKELQTATEQWENAAMELETV
jgi:ATP-binding cassette, subfamily F, member 3